MIINVKERRIASESEVQKIQLTARKQSGAIPYKLDKYFEVKYLLVQKTGSRKWGFPKGKVEDHLGKKKSALTEAWEEAGVRGKIVKFIGRYKYIKNKTRRMQQVDLFLMQVTDQKSNYLETERKRKWFTFDEAMRVLEKTQLPYLVLANREIEDIENI